MPEVNRTEVSKDTELTDLKIFPISKGNYQALKYQVKKANK